MLNLLLEVRSRLSALRDTSDDERTGHGVCHIQVRTLGNLAVTLPVPIQFHVRVLHTVGEGVTLIGKVLRLGVTGEVVSQFSLALPRCTEVRSARDLVQLLGQDSLKQTLADLHHRSLGASVVEQLLTARREVNRTHRNECDKAHLSVTQTSVHVLSVNLVGNITHNDVGLRSLVAVGMHLALNEVNRNLGRDLLTSNVKSHLVALDQLVAVVSGSLTVDENATGRPELKESLSLLRKRVAVAHRNGDFHTVRLVGRTSVHNHEYRNVVVVLGDNGAGTDTVLVTGNGELTSVGQSTLGTEAKHTGHVVGVLLGGLTVLGVNLLDIVHGKADTVVTDLVLLGEVRRSGHVDGTPVCAKDHTGVNLRVVGVGQVLTDDGTLGVGVEVRKNTHNLAEAGLVNGELSGRVSVDVVHHLNVGGAVRNHVGSSL